MPVLLKDLEKRVSLAVSHYWKTLASQSRRQRSGDADRGGRTAVTGGKQMDGFSRLVTQILTDNGIPDAHIYRDRKLELPGYFRPTKKWDLVVVSKGNLIAAMEFKSQRGPSFGNNFNNRSEEAIGTAHDLWTAFREGAFDQSPRPWLGWIMLLQDCAGSRSPVRADEPHFPVFPEFKNTSYMKRYELFLRKLVRERLYDAAAFIVSTEKQGKAGQYTEPAKDLHARQFFASLGGHIGTFLAGQTYI
ncbi:MAG: PaeR7I family type II restriction endonuclease [Elusimicrobia bacterium]|nr:PaeR7I family type II restriction endonuclease [Elusimicrobiota bacterium]